MTLASGTTRPLRADGPRRSAPPRDRLCGGLLRAIALACGCGALLALGCGGDSSPFVPEDPAIAKTLAGWTQFESGDLAAAKATFRDAISVSNGYADAHNGLGWSLALLDSLSSAHGAFVSAIASNPPNAEPWAGRAFVRAELPSFELTDALADAGIALGRAPRFTFAHDPDVDWRDLRLLRAQLFFELDEIDSAAAEVDSLGGNLPSPSEPAFADSLLREIERLRTMVAPPAL